MRRKSGDGDLAYYGSSPILTTVAPLPTPIPVLTPILKPETISLSVMAVIVGQSFVYKMLLGALDNRALQHNSCLGPKIGRS